MQFWPFLCNRVNRINAEIVVHMFMFQRPLTMASVSPMQSITEMLQYLQVRLNTAMRALG